jgi:hypothetical protein
MTTERKARSNRLNSRLSTGPRTPQGRAKSAGNAQRHRLSARLSPVALAEAQMLAGQIAGAGAPRELHDLARSIAHADLELQRIRKARSQHLSRALAMFADSTGVGVDSGDQSAAAAIQSRELRTLLAIDRYQRRALARRRVAMRAFMRKLRELHRS